MEGVKLGNVYLTDEDLPLADALLKDKKPEPEDKDISDDLHYSFDTDE